MSELFRNIAKMIQCLVVLIGKIAFLLLFALAPLHALILVGLMVALVGLTMGKSDVQKISVYAGIFLVVLGIAGIFIPALMSGF